MKKIFFILLPVMLLFFWSCGGETTPKEKTNAGKKESTDTLHKSETTAGKKEFYYGIDISQWNGNLLEEMDTMDSLSFVICKATEGIDYVDPDFSKNRKLLKEKKVICGVYHFYHCNDDPVKQAEFFTGTVQQWENNDMAPIVDIEEASLPKGKNADLTNLQPGLLQFLQQVETKTHRKPIIYTDLTFANKFLTDTTFSHYPLWLAEYSGNTAPAIPATWKTTGYKIWQKSDSYSIQSDAVDFDVYFGVMEGLWE